MQKEKTITIKSNTEQSEALHFFKDVLGCSVKVVSDNMFIACLPVGDRLTVINGKIGNMLWWEYEQENLRVYV